MANKDFWTCTIILLGVLALTFIAGVDKGWTKRDEATESDRITIYCATPGHIETFCEKKK